VPAKLPRKHRERNPQVLCISHPPASPTLMDETVPHSSSVFLLDEWASMKANHPRSLNLFLFWARFAAWE